MKSYCLSCNGATEYSGFSIPEYCSHCGKAFRASAQAIKPPPNQSKPLTKIEVEISEDDTPDINITKADVDIDLEGDGPVKVKDVWQQGKAGIPPRPRPKGRPKNALKDIQEQLAKARKPFSDDLDRLSEN